MFVADEPYVSQDSELLNRVLTIENFIGQNYKSDYKDLLSMIGGMSEKIHKLQSDLREFEKQKVAPLREVLSSHDCRINNIYERIEKLEQHTNTNQDSKIMPRLDGHGLQIHEIEKLIDSLKKSLENYREYKTGIEDLETDTMYIKQRLDKLESSSGQSNDQFFHDELVQHEHRIEKLEAKQSPLAYGMSAPIPCATKPNTWICDTCKAEFLYGHLHHCGNKIASDIANLANNWMS